MSGATLVLGGHGGSNREEEKREDNEQVTAEHGALAVILDYLVRGESTRHLHLEVLI